MNDRGDIFGILDSSSTKNSFLLSGEKNLEAPKHYLVVEPIRLKDISQIGSTSQSKREEYTTFSNHHQVELTVSLSIQFSYPFNLKLSMSRKIEPEKGLIIP